MIVGIGCDLVDIRRIEAMLKRFDGRATARLFTVLETERAAVSPHPASSYAKRFAAKEAFAKALGTGIAQGLTWRDVEVAQGPGGKPLLNLSDQAWGMLLGKDPEFSKEKIQLDLSLSDEYPYAQAFVIISRKQTVHG